MRRRLFNLSAAISLLICLACVCLWACRFAGRVFEVGGGACSISLSSERVGMRAGVDGPRRLPSPPAAPLLYGTTVHSRWDYYWARCWQYWGPQMPSCGKRTLCSFSWEQTQRYVYAPYWLLTVITGIVPALWLRQWRREMRAAGLRGRGFAVKAQA